MDFSRERGAEVGGGLDLGREREGLRSVVVWIWVEREGLRLAVVWIWV